MNPILKQLTAMAVIVGAEKLIRTVPPHVDDTIKEMMFTCGAAKLACQNAVKEANGDREKLAAARKLWLDHVTTLFDRGIEALLEGSQGANPLEELIKSLNPGENNKPKAVFGGEEIEFGDREREIAQAALDGKPCPDCGETHEIDAVRRREIEQALKLSTN